MNKKEQTRKLHKRTANATPSRGVRAGTRGRKTAVTVLEHLSKKKFTV